MKREVEIFDEENSIVIDDKHTTDTFDFFPEQKKFKVSSSIKDDVFYNNSTIEYKISDDPIELKMRTVELSHEPPLEYSIKDGVVLESDIKKKDFVMPDRIANLKKEVEWTKVPILNNYEVNLFILSKHPEIISKEDYRKFLRQSLERVKLGISKAKEAVKEDAHGLEIHESEYGKSIWYPDSEAEKKEMDEYYDLPEEKRKGTNYAKKLEYIEKFNDSLFKENSPKYVGISDQEFRSGDEMVDYIAKLLEKKDVAKKEPVEKVSKGKGIIISLLLTLFLSWVVSWFVDINPFLIFVIVQVVAFTQSIIGGWLGKFFE